MAEKAKRFSRRATALLWCFAVAVVIGVLIYFEQIAVLYVLATLGLVLLLLIVGFSDLENVGRENIEPLTPTEE
jgi:Kef-type K+ transport system membrane component KefB